MTKLEAVGYVDISKGFVGKRPRTTYKLTETGRHAFEHYRVNLKDLLNAAE